MALGILRDSVQGNVIVHLSCVKRRTQKEATPECMHLSPDRLLEGKPVLSIIKAPLPQNTQGILHTHTFYEFLNE